MIHAESLPPGWSEADFASSLRMDSRIVLKASSGEQPFGFIALQFAADEAEILTVAVRADRRRRGAGYALIAESLALCAERETSCVYLEVAEGNAPARSLYEKCGFRLFARRENYYQSARPTPECALILRIDLHHGGAAG
jgi:ribosomal-protein-alanine N-acetyltransferase